MLDELKHPSGTNSDYPDWMPPPQLVNHIQSDGIRVSVTLCTYGTPAPGISVLQKKGFQNITQELDLSKNHRGLFRSVKPIPEEILNALDECVPDCFIDVVGVDRGAKELMTYVSTRLNSDTIPESFRTLGGTKKSSAEYRFESLAKKSQQYETSRRAADPEYAAAIASFSSSGASLKSETGTVLYVDLLYQHIHTIWQENCSVERLELRFARHRAKERAISRLARDLAGGSPEAAALRNEKSRADKNTPDNPEKDAVREKMRKYLKSGTGSLRKSRSYRTWARVVFFGSAEFGHGKYGPLPFKALLKKIAELCCVVLTDEYNTSKMCCGGCGEKLKQQKGSRVFRCKNGDKTDFSPQRCSVDYIDRDVNAGVSMGYCGSCSLRGEARPVYLTRPERAALRDCVVQTE